MSDSFLVKVPHSKGHSHFSNWVSDFPQLHQHHHDDHAHAHGHGHGQVELSQKEKTLNYLRGEMVELATHQREVLDRLCYRRCLKLGDRDYVDYCLKEKCGQTDFFAAARQLGLLKD